MKKYLLIILFATFLSSCKFPEKTYEEYGNGKCLDSLYMEARDLRGIGIINIYDTKADIVNKLKKHNSKFKHKFDNFYKEAKFDRESIFQNEISISKKCNEDNVYNLCYIVDNDTFVYLELYFYRDTLYMIDLDRSWKGKNHIIYSAFETKYGEGCGYHYYYRNFDITGEPSTWGIETYRVWQNDRVKAKYEYVLHCSKRDSGNPYCSHKFDIKVNDSTFLQRVNNYKQSKLDNERRKEEEKRQSQIYKL